MSFRTYFVRPNLFRFDWSDYHPYIGKAGGAHDSVVWANPDGAFAKYHFGNGKVEHAETYITRLLVQQVFRAG